MEGLWLRAVTQTDGRGRLGRSWQSPPGNLHASTIVRLRPTDPPAPTLGFVAAVALEEIASIYAPLTIKWPNDLLLGDAKLAGILLERTTDAVVIGFGVNLAHHPGDLDRPTASLPGAPDPALFLEDLAAAFARWLARWRGEGFAPVRARWLERAHPKGAALATTEGVGLFQTIDESGALILRLADGATRAIHAGDVFPA